MTRAPAKLKVATPNDLQIVMTREFDAPRRLVWDAMTKADLVRRWMFCPPGWSWAKCEMDVRVGGAYCWEWNGPDGRLAMTIRGVHREVDPPSRVVHTERMEMAPGAGPCAPDGGPPEPWELVATLELSEQGAVTSMKMTLAFGSKQARDVALASGMEQGMEAGYQQLDAFLASGATGA
ncbi:MAG TPA: SRPBCC family protein [Phycisphaerae bacterium]|nr:SRPBCC family protein [Phycisphaerae bacterium]